MISFSLRSLPFFRKHGPSRPAPPEAWTKVSLVALQTLKLVKLVKVDFLYLSVPEIWRRKSFNLSLYSLYYIVRWMHWAWSLCADQIELVTEWCMHCTYEVSAFWSFGLEVYCDLQQHNRHSSSGSRLCSADVSQTSIYAGRKPPCWKRLVLFWSFFRLRNTPLIDPSSEERQEQAQVQDLACTEAFVERKRHSHRFSPIKTEPRSREGGVRLSSLCNLLQDPKIVIIICIFSWTAAS